MRSLGLVDGLGVPVGHYVDIQVAGEGDTEEEDDE